MGLYLNKDRTVVRQGLIVAIGAGLALGGGSAELFRLIADNENDAAYMAYKYESAKQKNQEISTRINGS